MLQNQEFIREFVEEALVHVENVESGLLKIDENRLDPENINNIFRAVHSMKGTAGFFGLKKIVELSHSMENIFGEIRNGKFQIDHDLIDLMLSANDCLKSMLADVLNSDNTDISMYLGKLKSIMEGTAFIPPAPQLSISSDEASKSSPSDELSQKSIIENNLKHGHKIYSVKLSLNGDLGSKNISPVQFFKKLESVGSLVKSSSDISTVDNLDNGLIGDIQLNLIFTTVLGKELLPLALDIPLDKIIETDIDTALAKEAVNQQETVFAEEAQISVGQTALIEENKDPSNKVQSLPVEDSVRVHVTLLNSLLNLASEMVLGRNQLLRAVEKHRRNIPGIDPILQNIDRITTELQEKIMQTRMQPIANVFNKFPRITRDLAKKLNKEIDLQLSGVDVELDKSIIEALADPLTHLVRNAADHGLEAPEIREKQGKARVGIIELKAYHEGGYVNIDVIDDGAGINLDKIKQKALEKQLVSKKDLSVFTEQEVMQLLFKPGFSTVEKVTDVSGRGVGMDVVRTNIEKLGGTIEIYTKLNSGTTFRLLLPLTLAIIPSLIVEVGHQRFALPQVNLQEIVRIKPGDLNRRIEYIHDAEVLRLRGRLLPIVHLADALGIKKTYADPVTGEIKEDKRKTLHDKRYKNPEPPFDSAADFSISSMRESNSSIIRILVLKIGAKRFGIAVDSILGTEETLVKPMPVYIKSCKCYSGVTIMGDGKAAMILDPEGIIEKSNLKFIEGQVSKSDKDEEKLYEHMNEQQNLLLFKSSGHETFAMDLSLVSRVEEINAGDIEKIGEREYIKFRGDSLRVIRPEDFLSVSRGKNDNKKYYVIIPKLVKHSIGILIESITDTVQTAIKLNQEDIKQHGLIGSTILNNSIVLLINLYELFEKAAPEFYSAELAKKADTKRTILVAEDTPFFQRMEKSYLETAGYNVLLAANGKEAFEILVRNEVDVLVSDINMPVMDGLELVKKIREDKRLKSLPVIAVTSLTGDLQKRTGFEAGFDYYEFKLDRANLLEKVELALKKKREAV